MKLIKIITVLLLVSYSSVTYAGDGGGIWGENSFGSSNTNKSSSSVSNHGNTISNNRFGISNSSNDSGKVITYKKKYSGIKKFLNKIFGIKFKSKTNKIKIGDLSTSDPSSVPVDGELGLLLLGAAAFGYKKLRGKKKNVEK